MKRCKQKPEMSLEEIKNLAQALRRSAQDVPIIRVNLYKLIISLADHIQEIKRRPK